MLREQSQNEVVIGGGDGVADRVTFVSCDLGNLAEVKKVGDEIRKEEKRMDVVSIPLLFYSHFSGY